MSLTTALTCHRDSMRSCHARLLASLCAAAEDIKPWWIWFYWINPLTYAQQGVLEISLLRPSYCTALMSLDSAGELKAMRGLERSNRLCAQLCL